MNFIGWNVSDSLCLQLSGVYFTFNSHILVSLYTRKSSDGDVSVACIVCTSEGNNYIYVWWKKCCWWLLNRGCVFLLYCSYKTNVLFPCGKAKLHLLVSQLLLNSECHNFIVSITSHPLLLFTEHTGIQTLLQDTMLHQCLWFGESHPTIISAELFASCHIWCSTASLQIMIFFIHFFFKYGNL